MYKEISQTEKQEIKGVQERNAVQIRMETPLF